jgi:hypothetical protein
MSTTIQIKRSSTASAVPLAGDLAVGELAVNLADKRLFAKQADGTIIELSTNPTDLDAATLRIDGVEITASATELNSLDGLTATTAELNILDGVTATATELNKLDGFTGSTAELNLLDGVTATTSELNVLDGITATTTELNYTDGVTSSIQTQLSNKQPLDPQLTDISILIPTDGSFIVGDGTNFVTESGNTAIASLGVTATAAELNTLDGITASTTELNYTDGVTSNIQTQLNGKATSAQGALADSAVQPDDNVSFGTGSFSGTLESTGYFSVNGTVGNTGSATDRWIGGDGTTGTWFYNVPTGSSHYFAINNSNKLAINGTGVDVTGTITADGLTVDGGTDSNVILGESGGTAALYTLNDAGNDNTNLRINAENLDIYTDGVKVFSALDGGDVHFYEDTGTTAKFVWDASAESLGIGTTSPAANSRLHAKGASSYDGKIIADNSSDTGSGIFSVYQNGTSRGFIGTSGSALGDTSSDMAMFSNNGIRLYTGNSTEKARIDSSGNLLVGGTSAYAVNSTTITSNGMMYSSVSGGHSLELNRNTTDGDIARFNKDGSTVGSIGAEGGDLVIGTGTTAGLQFNDATPTIRPWNMSANTRTDGVCDLGYSNSRFKDLYLSGGVITSSDYRLKEDVQPMQSYADTIKQMNLVNFAWKDSGKREDGFIAHELQALVPSAVRGDKDAIDEDGNEQYQGVDPLKLMPVLTKALQEALERIETLENK